MDARYNSEELKGVGIKEFPSKGLYCPKCQTWIPQFKDLTEVTETRLKALIRENKQIMAIKELQDEVGCNERWAKIWVIHSGKPSPEYPGSPCPYCHKPLRTTLAKQCPHCFESWHTKEG